VATGPGKIPVTISYQVDVSQFVAAMEAMAKQCADAAEAMRRFAEAHDASADADPEAEAKQDALHTLTALDAGE